MTKVLYYLCSLQEWVPFAKELQTALGWKPVYWIGTQNISHPIRETFADCIFHEKGRAKFGFFETDYNDTNWILDDSTIEAIAYEENIAISMLERHSVENSFPLLDRKRFFRSAVNNWSNIISNLEIDVIFFEDPPHLPSMYALYVAAKYLNNTQVRFLVNTQVCQRVVVNEDVRRSPPLLEKTYQEIIGSEKNIELPRDLEDHVRKLQGDYNQAIPWYMQEAKQAQKPTKKLHLKRLVKKQTHRIRQLLEITKKPIPSHMKTIRSVEDFKAVYMGDAHWMKARQQKYKKKLAMSYNAKSQAPDLQAIDYIYLPLQLQPERTTNPEGGIYDDVSIIIRMLLSVLPKKWKLLIKENPKQFSHCPPGGWLLRQEKDYEEWCADERMVLVNLSVSTFDLIDCSKCTITITGIAALEALARGVKSAVFGTPWFGIAKNVRHVGTCATLERFMEDTENMVMPHDKCAELMLEDLRRLFVSLSDTSVKGYINSHEKRVSEISEQRNIVNLVKLVCQYEAK